MEHLKLSTSRAFRSASNFRAQLATQVRVLAAVCAVAGTFAASATLAADATAQSPLVDRIWDVRAQRFIHPVDLTTVLAKADFVLLGEIHDKAEQHRRQATVIASLATAGRRPAIAFEQFDREYQPDLDRAERTDLPDLRLGGAAALDACLPAACEPRQHHHSDCFHAGMLAPSRPAENAYSYVCPHQSTTGTPGSSAHEARRFRCYELH